jgi:hypothetical protein
MDHFQFGPISQHVGTGVWLAPPPHQHQFVEQVSILLNRPGVEQRLWHSVPKPFING